MGSVEGKSKENLTFKLLSLSQAEIEELLTFLFRKLHYGVIESTHEGDLLYFHLTAQEGRFLRHALACWTGGNRILAPDFLQSFLKTPPFTGTTFQRGFFLSPYEFAADFKQEAEKNHITPISGQGLLELLEAQGLDYYFPSFLEAIGKRLRKRLPWIIAPLILVYGIFMYETVRTHTEPVNLGEPTVVATESPTPTESPVPAPTENSEVSLLTPERVAQVEQPNVLYKRIEMPSGPIPKKTQAPSINELPETLPTETSPPPILQLPPSVEKPSQRKPASKPTPSPRPASKPSAQPKQAPAPASAYKIINKYSHTVDLEEKYFRTAEALDKQHYNAKAKAYYQKYLQIAPDGDYADIARAALKRL